MTDKPSILSCGEVLWDLFPDATRFGGAPVNFACHASRLGAEVSLLSAVGDDPRGDEAIAILQGFGIDTTLIQRVSDAPTGSVGVSLDAAGKPKFAIHEGSAWDHIPWTEELEARIANVDAVYFGTLGQRGELSRATNRRALVAAKGRNVLRMLDVNLRAPFYDNTLIRESIAEASVLKLSDDELAAVSAACGLATDENPEKMLRALQGRYGLALVVMTRGAEGAMVVSAAETLDQPGIPTTVCDTVGAGDSFTAAFTVGLLRGEALKDILKKACEIASVACSQQGGVPTH